MGSHSLLQGIIPPQGLNQQQENSLLLSQLGSPTGGLRWSYVSLLPAKHAGDPQGAALWRKGCLCGLLGSAPWAKFWSGAQEQKEQLNEPNSGSTRDINRQEHSCNCGPASTRGFYLSALGALGSQTDFPEVEGNSGRRSMSSSAYGICSSTWRNKRHGHMCTLEWWWGDIHLTPCVHANSLQSCLTLCDPMDCSLSGPLSMGFSRQE